MTNPKMVERARDLFAWQVRIDTLTALDEAREQLAAVTAERDRALGAFRTQQGETRAATAKLASLYDQIEHAKKQRDEAIEQAKQAQGELAALKVQHAGVQMERDLANERLRGARDRVADLEWQYATSLAAAPKAACSCQWSPVQGRIWCDSCAAARDAVVEAAAAPNADEPFTTPCVAAELGVAHPAHTVSAKAAINCPGAERKYTVSPDDCACMEVAHLGDPKCPRCGRELSWELPAAAPDPAAVPHTFPGLTHKMFDREHPAHAGQTCEEWEAAHDGGEDGSGTAGGGVPA